MARHEQAQTLLRPVRRHAPVLVGLLGEPDRERAGIARHLTRWRRLTPLASWTVINIIEISRSGILQSVAEVLDERNVPPRRLILIGEGDVARLALELVLDRALDCAGILAIGISGAALPSPIVPVPAAIRLVIQGDSPEITGDLTSALRSSDMDVRIIGLNPATGRDVSCAGDAAETFVLELVATVGRPSWSSNR
jgi:predicted esterase